MCHVVYFYRTKKSQYMPSATMYFQQSYIVVQWWRGIQMLALADGG